MMNIGKHTTLPTSIRRQLETMTDSGCATKVIVGMTRRKGHRMPTNSIKYKGIKEGGAVKAIAFHDKGLTELSILCSDPKAVENFLENY